MSDRPVALVTGASSGIGAELARLLAASGHDLVVVARRRRPLEELAQELHTAHGTTVELLPLDLQSATGIQAVVERVSSGHPLAMVTNNAGFGWYGPLVEQPTDSMESMVTVNVTAVTAVSRAAAASMVPRRSGAILNVSSTAGFVPGPLSAVYHATKAFVTSLTEALHEEVRPYGVHVTALCPGITPTGFQERAHVDTRRVPAFALTDARSVAIAGLAAVARNQAICVPGVANRLGQVGSQLAPRSVVRRMSGQVLKRL